MYQGHLTRVKEALENDIQFSEFEDEQKIP